MPPGVCFMPNIFEEPREKRNWWKENSPSNWNHSGKSRWQYLFYMTMKINNHSFANVFSRFADFAKMSTITHKANLYPVDIRVWVEIVRLKFLDNNYWLPFRSVEINAVWWSKCKTASTYTQNCRNWYPHFGSYNYSLFGLWYIWPSSGIFQNLFSLICQLNTVSVSSIYFYKSNRPNYVILVSLNVWSLLTYTLREIIMIIIIA